MRPWLQDPDGDGTYTWSDRPDPGRQLRVQGRPRPVAGTRTTATAATTWRCQRRPRDGDGRDDQLRPGHPPDQRRRPRGPAPRPDLRKAKAFWVDPDLVAWPATLGARRRRPGLAAVAAALVADRRAGGGRRGRHRRLGGDAARTTPPGCRRRSSRAHPELKGYLALRLAGRRPRQAGGDPARAGGRRRCTTPCGAADRRHRRADRRRAGRPVRARAASTRTLRRHVAAPQPSFCAVGADRAGRCRCWSGRRGQRPRRVSEAARVAMQRGADGSWSVTGTRPWRGARYLYEVTVYAPTTGKVETNLVTDPYSVALTLNSTRSVAVDLHDPAFQPALWRAQTPPPALKQDVDSDDLRAARARLLDRRHDRAGRAPRHLPRVRRRRRRHQAPQGARRRRA